MDRKTHPFLDVVRTRQKSLDRRLGLGRLNRREIPELTEIHTKNDHALVGAQFNGTKNCPIATQPDNEVEAHRKLIWVNTKFGPADSQRIS
jgi:hypothetical protein